MIRLLRRFAEVSARERAAFAQALLLIAAVRIALTLSSAKATLGLCERFITPSHSDSPAPDGTLNDVTVAVRRAGRLVPKATCLTQAIAAKALLARRGLDSDLHFGVKKESDGKLLAHAWLEMNGRVIIGETERDQYTPLVSTVAL